MLDGVKGSIRQTGNAVFVGKNRYGAFTDSEAKKKAHTDARGKALSLLGFGADVFLGLFDDHNYVKEAAIEHEIDREEAKVDDKKKLFDEHCSWFESQLETLRNSQSENEAKGCSKTVARKLQATSKRQGYAEIVNKQMIELNKLTNEILEKLGE